MRHQTFMIIVAMGLSLSLTAAAASIKKLVLQRKPEPKEQAFTILVPKGWTVEGGIYWVHPDTAGGPANSVEKKCDLTIKRDSAGTMMLRLLPEVYYADSARGAGLYLFPYGSNYQGMVCAPLISAQQFLNQAVRLLRPQARDLKVIEQKSLPEVARAYGQRTANLPFGIRFNYDAAIVTFAYEENGTHYKERMFTIIEDRGQIAGGQWCNRSTIIARTPADEFDQWEPVFSMMLNSIEIDTQWLLKEIKEQLERAGIIISTQKEIQEIERQIAEHKQKTNAEIQNDMFLTLTGQAEFVDPYTKKVMIGSDAFKHQWINPSGEVVVSNDDNYSPNHDVEINRSDFKEMSRRKR